MTSVCEFKSLLKSIIRSSPAGHSNIFEIRRQLKVLENINLFHYVRSKGFNDPVSMISSWNDEFSVIGYGNDALVKVNVGDHITEMNRFNRYFFYKSFN